MRNTDQTVSRPQGRKRPALLQRLGFSTMLGALPLMVSCAFIPEGSDPNANPPPVETLVFSAPQEDLNSLQYNPTFEPDYNRLTPQPGVETATKQEQDVVDVYPDRLEFPEAMSAVLAWQPGRIVAAAPGEGTGRNPMGFARRVVSVAKVSPKIVVNTTTVGIEDLIQGDVQIQLKPEDSKPMDLAKADLDWVANNLYYNAEDIFAMPGEPLVDDSDDIVGLGFFSSVGKALSGAAKAVAKVAVQVYLAVTPATVGGSTGFDKTVKASSKSKLFGPLKYSHDITTKKGKGVTLSISGSGGYDAVLEFQQGLQFGAKIALPGHNANSEFWLNVDSRLYTRIQLELELEAAIEAALGQSGAGLQATLDTATDITQDILAASRESFFGDKDVKPASSWKKTLFLTQPSLALFFAGPIPVALTSTFQVDLECGLEAKASIKTNLLWEQNATFKFKAKYEKGSGRMTYEGPTFDAKKTFDVKVTGGGSVSVSCGLIPRVNVLMYDTVGLFAGIRASLIARAGYESQCKPDPNNFRPTGKVTLGLYGNVGLQIGARVQTPGSSFAGAKGTAVGYDFGPLEPWNTEFKLYEKNWEFAKGLGYCTPLCKNGTKDGDESDADCGGSCGRCVVGKSCKRNSDCANSVCNAGKCSTNKCGDTVTDGLETDTDCGGPTAECATRCATGKLCEVGTDCATGFCSAKGTAMANRCITDFCIDGVRDGDEGGIDCGGARCAKCANGVKVTAATHCASGLWNGTACVGAICDDNIKSGNETGPDCGGPTCTTRCGFQLGCATAADCGPSAPVCEGTRKVCLRGPGMACQSNADCGAGTCTNSVCSQGPWTLQTTGTMGTLYGLWGVDANNVWAVGANGVIIRWNGMSWNAQTSGTTTYLLDIGGVDKNNVWVTMLNGGVLRWDGTAWSTQVTGTSVQLQGIWAANANNVWAVGEAGVIRKWNGTAWSGQTSGISGEGFNDVWGLDANNVWAVGSSGTIVKWNGTSWTAQSSGSTAGLRGVFVADANNAWAVGDNGTILKWNGTSWAAQNSGTTNQIAKVHGVDASHVWATGQSGTILKWDGNTWSPEISDSPEYLYGVWAATASSVWAGGSSGTVLRSP